jgi:cytochrome c
MKHSLISLAALATVAAVASLLAGPAHAAGHDDAMLKLANASGCLACHHIEPGTKGPDGLAPVGPAWRDVAAKYHGQKAAADTLTQTVLAGSSPYASHWKGQVSGLAMPPNQVAITPADAKALVKWILTLDAAKKS